MPLELKKNPRTTKPRKSTKQTLIIKLCPFMSRRITHPAYVDGQNYGHEEELVRQPCVQDDCAVWDMGNGCCSLSATSRARELVGEAYGDKVDVTLHTLNKRPEIRLKKPRKRTAHPRK
jgi:hypothetical protein